MSIDSVVRSLAPIGAEDETLRNTQSVPAMLKLSKDLLGRHLTVLDQVVSHFSVEDKLSTVMGNLDLKATSTKQRKLLIDEGMPRLNKLLSDLDLTGQADETDGAATVAAVRKELHELIRKSIAQTLSSEKMKTAGDMITKTIEDELIKPLEGSLKTHLQRAMAFQNQCIILSAGPRTGQPWKKEKAIKDFDSDVSFLVEQVEAVKIYRKNLLEARELANTTLAQTSVQDQVSNKETSDLLSRLQNNINHTITGITAMEKEICARFNDGAQITSRESVRKLTIPADVIEKSKGAWVRAEIPPWVKGMTDRLWAIIPWINRILNDYDALLGEYWKPPSNEQAETQVPEIFRDEWLRANRALYATLRPILGETFMAQFQSTYSIGANGQKTAKALEDDGLSLIFALVTLSSPNTSTYKDGINRQIHGCAELARSGNPTDFVKQARICLQECIRLNISVNWHVAKQIIDIFTQRHNQFSRDLNTPNNFDYEDCAPEFDALLTKISDVNEKIKETWGDVWWTGNTGTAHSAVQAKPVNVGNSSEWCRFGKDCTKRDSGMCKRFHDMSVNANRGKGKDAKGKGKGKSSKGKGATNSTQQAPTGAARCAKQGCTETSSPHGELCGGCYIKAKNEGGYTNLYGKQIQIVTNSNSDRQKARKAAKACGKATANSAADKKDDDDSLDPPIKGVYLSLEQYQLFQNNKVKTNNTTDTNFRSGIGEELGRHISGPASYKLRIVSEFLKDDLYKNINISNLIPKFVEFVKK